MPDHPTLTRPQLLTLEAFADTVVPGRKRGPDDVSVAGVHPTPGAVEAGALDVLTHAATGLADGVGGMADLLNERVTELAPAQDGLPAFVRLDYARRRAVVAELTSPLCPERELWFLLALFAYMAYDSAPHLDTAEALAAGHPGLRQLGFAGPQDDGFWRASPASYGHVAAAPRSGTTSFGDPS